MVKILFGATIWLLEKEYGVQIKTSQMIYLSLTLKN